MKLAPYIKTARTVITANSPVLLLGTTIVGVVTTGVLGARAGWNARGKVDLETVERGETLTPQEIVQLTWSEFTLPVISGAGTIAAAVGTHTIHTKRAAAMSALYAVTSSKLDDYTERAEELLGPKKTQQLTDDVAQRQVDRNPLESDSQVLLTEDGTELCFDEWTGRYFRSSIAKLENAINDVNRLILDTDEASLNDFYECVGLPIVTSGENVGWHSKIEGKFGAVNVKDGRTAISVSFRKAPAKLS